MLKTQFKKKPKNVLINFIVTLEEKKKLKRKADLYADGNISAWLKYAGIQLSARKRDVVRKVA